MAELLDHGVERGIRVIGRALVAQQKMRLAGDRLDQRLADARLADPGLAGQQHRLTFAARRLPPALKQQAEFLVAADDRRHAT